jgi:hypothetical protein
MPNRVQTLRSSVPGNLPQAGTRQPGELWVNFADAQTGYIDASQTAQKLLAVRLFVSTASYATGDFVVYTGALYQAIAPSAAGAFTASNWTKIGTAQDLSQYLLLAGGTLTGALNLPAAAPTVATQATNKSYVDAGDAAATTVANTKLPLAGGTLTGALNGTTATFSGVAAAADPPAQDSSSKLVTTAWFNGHQPVTKENSNRVLNGDMRIDQRNNGASGTVNNVYTVDRWTYSSNQASKGAWQRILANVGGPIQIAGFNYYLSFTSSSAYAVAAGDAFYFSQPIEADMVGDLAWGTASAQSVTLSFWALSSLAGTFSGAIRNYPAPATRSYPFTFALAANTWTKVVVTIPGDTGGTWVLAGNAAALGVLFDLGSGATFRGPANAWASANYVGANGAVSVVAVNGATFYLTGVKLEIGSVATPFNRQSLAKSMADCQRYYATSYYGVSIGAANASSGQLTIRASGLTNAVNTLTTNVFFPVSMRSAPTLTYFSTITGAPAMGRDAVNNVDVAALPGAFGSNSCIIGFNPSAATTAPNFLFHYVASAEL